MMTNLKRMQIRAFGESCRAIRGRKAMDTLITLLMLGFAFIIGVAVGAAATIIGMEERKYEEFSNMGSKNNIQTDDKDGI